MNYSHHKAEMLEAIGSKQLNDEFTASELSLIEQGKESYFMIQRIHELYEMTSDSMDWLMDGKSTSAVCQEVDYAY